MYLGWTYSSHTLIVFALLCIGNTFLVWAGNKIFFFYKASLCQMHLLFGSADPCNVGVLDNGENQDDF